jgi:hypothetical protein
MPSRRAVEELVALVEAGRGLEALEACYGEDASMQENGAPPRRGKAVLLAHEAAAQAAVVDLKARCVRPILVEGDVVVIRWVFEYLDRAGRPIRFEELAWQRWAGDRIVEEQFFYDPGQFRPKS